MAARRSWRLNEGHYGGLQGLNKAETAARYGEAQVKIWARSYDTAPPPLEPGGQGDASLDSRYADLAPDLIPACECLNDVEAHRHYRGFGDQPRRTSTILTPPQPT